MIFLDSSILIAAAQPHHPHFEPSAKLIREATRANTACGLHSLAETFSTLSGMPKPMRFPPAAALQIIEQTRQRMTIIALTEREYAATFQSVTDAGLGGGIVYDALLLQCARKVQAKKIYTWNVNHFRLGAPDLASRIFAP
jgi:predicted nucleic acid-binding protein